MTILIDEVEAHLHPKWQRTVLPSLLDVVQSLSEDTECTVWVTTHSPLILASLETIFNKSEDKLFHLSLSGSDVNFGEVPFVKYGRVDEWLTSEIFELKQPRSVDGENAVEKANQLLAAKNPSRDAILAVTRELRTSVASDDEIWPRWVYFAETNGVKL